MTPLTITPRSAGGVTISGDEFATPVNGDQLQDALFFQNTLALPPDIVLRVTQGAVIITRPGSVHWCPRAAFVDIVRGLLPKLRAEVWR